MKRFAVLLLTLALAVCCTLPAFAADTIEVNEDVSVSGDYDWTRFKGQNMTLNVYNWGEYISNGSDDSLDVVSAFEDLTGIKVNYTTFDSNESMYAKLKSGAADYDVVIPSDYMVAKMIAEGMLKPLNYDNIPNFQKIDAEYRNPDYDPQNAYTVPYMLCTTGIIYNTTMVDKAPTSWADLWDEQYAGNILMFNNSRDAYAIAAFKSGHDINPQSTEEVDEVVKELKAQKPLVQAYVMDEIFDKMIGGEAAVGVYYSGDAITMIDDNPDLAWVFPEEGSVLSVDCRWILVDLTGGHIMREPNWTVENFWNETVEGELPLHTHRCKELTSAGECRASYSLCDLNGHINNAYYLDLACDALPPEVLQAGPVTFAAVNYHREIPMGDTVELLYAPSEEGWYVQGRHDGRTSFECYLKIGS